MFHSDSSHPAYRMGCVGRQATEIENQQEMAHHRLIHRLHRVLIRQGLPTILDFWLQEDCQKVSAAFES